MYIYTGRRSILCKLCYCFGFKSINSLWSVPGAPAPLAQVPEKPRAVAADGPIDTRGKRHFTTSILSGWSSRRPQQFRTRIQLTSRTSRKLRTYKLRAAWEEAGGQSDRNEGHIVQTATGKTSAADISDSCLSKQKMLPHSGHQHTLWTSRTSEVNEPPIHTISLT